MPRLPALHIEALAELESQLRFAPREALLRDIARAEELATEIDPSREYPMEWVAFRITGYRPGDGSGKQVTAKSARRGAGDVQPGTAIRAALAPLVERLCGHAKLIESEVPPGAWTTDALLARWNVSRATLNRLRRRGLVGRLVLPAAKANEPDAIAADQRRGQGRLVFSPAIVEKFEREHASELSRAGRFSRLEEDLRERIVRWGRRYARAGVSLNEAARRIAQRVGRAHETIRRILQQDLRDAQRRQRTGTPSDPAAASGPSSGQFDLAPAINAARRRVLWRAWRWPIAPEARSEMRWEVPALAKRERRSPAAIRRAITLAHAEQLWTLLPDAATLTAIAPRWGTLSWHMGPTFALPGAGDAILAHPAVRTGLGNPGPRDVRELLVAARSKRATIPAEEAARAIATNFLLFDAARRLRALNRLHPKASDLDAIETALRWAARLKMELVRSQFRLVIETIEARLGRRVEELGGAGPRVLEDALLAACDGVDAFDPFRGSHAGGGGGSSVGRVAGPVGLQVDRVAVRWSKELASVPARRAASILAPDTPLADIARRVFRWQSLIEPDPRARAAADVLPANVLGWLSWRYGWAEGVSGLCIPHTLAEAVATGKSSTPSRASREDRAMVRAAVQVALQTGIAGR